MKIQHDLNLGDGDRLSVSNTDGNDIRLSFVVGKPGDGCPSGHHCSVDAGAAVRFARGIVHSVLKVRMNGLSFGEALEVLKAGGRVTRPSWNGKEMWLTLYRGSPEMERAFRATGWKPIRRSFIVMNHADQTLGPWNATQSDMLGEDWEVVRG